MSPDEAIGAQKAQLRRASLSARERLTQAELSAADSVLAGAGAAFVSGRRAACVAAYVSTGSEPPTRRLLEALRAGGTRVLLPVLLPDGDLDWAAYENPARLRPSSLRPRLLEPAGRLLGTAAVAAADVVLVPALAVDPAGNRLGRGGGSYDRALARARADAALVAVLHDGELVERVPVQPHDIPVGTALLPGGILELSPREVPARNSGPPSGDPHRMPPDAHARR